MIRIQPIQQIDMGAAKVESGTHKGHTHLECDNCSMWFETEPELKEHGMKVHTEKIPAM